MAITINSTPLDPLCNSYVSLAEMLAYVTDRKPDPAVRTAWVALSDDLKATYLANATRSLDYSCEWIGDRYSRDQKLDWPRSNAYYDGFLLDNTTFPQAVKDATCEMACWSMENNGVISISQNAGYDSIKVGPINIDFNENVGGSANKYFPDEVAYLLADYGVMRNPDLPGANRIRTTHLQRA